MVMRNPPLMMIASVRAMRRVYRSVTDQLTTFVRERAKVPFWINSLVDYTIHSIAAIGLYPPMHIHDVKTQFTS
jgi:hypothetical protein